MRFLLARLSIFASVLQFLFQAHLLTIDGMKTLSTFLKFLNL